MLEGSFNISTAFLITLNSDVFNSIALHMVLIFPLIIMENQVLRLEDWIVQEQLTLQLETAKFSKTSKYIYDNITHHTDRPLCLIRNVLRTDIYKVYKV